MRRALLTTRLHEHVGGAHERGSSVLKLLGHLALQSGERERASSAILTTACSAGSVSRAWLACKQTNPFNQRPRTCTAEPRSAQQRRRGSPTHDGGEEDGEQDRLCPVGQQAEERAGAGAAGREAGRRKDDLRPMWRGAVRARLPVGRLPVAWAGKQAWPRAPLQQPPAPKPLPQQPLNPP